MLGSTEAARAAPRGASPGPCVAESDMPPSAVERMPFPSGAATGGVDLWPRCIRSKKEAPPCADLPVCKAPEAFNCCKGDVSDGAQVGFASRVDDAVAGALKARATPPGIFITDRPADTPTGPMEPSDAKGRCGEIRETRPTSPPTAPGNCLDGAGAALGYIPGGESRGGGMAPRCMDVSREKSCGG